MLTIRKQRNEQKHTHNNIENVSKKDIFGNGFGFETELN